MQHVTVADALRHPTWNMGVKNTIDSASLMNKGLEVIKASRFFGLPAEQIHALVHRTSVAHGFAIFTDGNVGCTRSSGRVRWSERDASVKDAGTLIAGHGGVLDRFDSYLFGGLAFYFALWLIGMIPHGLWVS